MEQYKTVKDVAELFQVETRTVYRWISDGKLKAVKLPTGAVRITMEALEAFSKQDNEGGDQCQGPDQPSAPTSTAY